MDSSPETSIVITVNGEERSVPSRYELTDLLEDMDIDPEETSGVAVALNNSVVRRQDWNDVTLAEDDAIEVIQAQQGG